MDVGQEDFYLIIKDIISNKATVDILMQRIGSINSTTNNVDVIDSLADTLVFCDIEYCSASKEQRDILINIINSCRQANLLPDDILLDRFEVDTIAEAGAIPDKRQFTVSCNRIRTKLYFKQKKFNLLREENEGFAKVLTTLSQLNPSNQQEILETVIEIIGIFRIDPNRVLDLVLEVFEYHSRINYDVYLEFLNQFYHSPQKLIQLLIFKISSYVDSRNDCVQVPKSFYRLIAILIHKEIIELDDIYPYLVPVDSKILDYHKKLVEEAKAFSKKYNMAVVGEEKQTKSVIDSLSVEDRHIFEVDNQKVNICAHLLDLGDWDQALTFSKRLPEYYCFSSRRVASSACDLINFLIDPIYRECALPYPLNLKIRPVTQRKYAPEQIKDLQDLEARIFPMLIALGPFLGSNTMLLTKIVRILKHILTVKEGDQLKHPPGSSTYLKTLDVINDSILAATTLTGTNTSLAREIWALLENFSYQVRYKIYHNWRDDGSNPIMLRNRGQVLLRAKHLMKRLSKESVKFSARHIGKLCYSNPVIIINYILLHIQSYENLISLVVDALKFSPPIVFDVLIYCIIETLSDPHKNKKSADGMALAPWLINISTFAASIILRYKVEFIGFLDYIVHQLRMGNSLDLVLLKDLIETMTGIEEIQAINDERIEALMGGDILRTEGAYFNQVKNTRKSSARLKDVLIESRLVMQLCILIAQVRDSLLYHQQEPLKLIGKLYDQCQGTLVQYGVFLSMYLSIDDYINFLPPLEKLMTEHKLDPDSAFFLARPMIFHKIRSKFLAFKEEASKELTVEEGEAPELSFQAMGIKFVRAVTEVIDPIVEAMQPFLIEKYGANNLDPKLFVIFWTLSMSDIEVPIGCYEKKIEKLYKELEKLGDSKEDDQKRKRFSNLIQKLKQEQAEQIEHTAYIKMYLESQKNNLFCSGSNYNNVYLESRQFVQHCAFARSNLTAWDALYSARFLIFLHELKVEDYHTIICIDRLLCDITYMMGACTENEANHYGRFLNSVLKTTHNWHSDAKIFNEECEHHPGSVVNIENGSDHMTYELYRDICYKWHYRLTKAFSIALESNNYIQIRNALIVMTRVTDYYPAIKHFGKGISMKIDKLRKTEKDSRQDLYALATAYAGKLDDRKSFLIVEHNFHKVDDKRRSETPASTKTSVKRDSNASKNSNDHSNSNTTEIKRESDSQRKRTSDTTRSSSTSRPSSKTRPVSPTVHRERHSSSSSRKKARHN